MNLPPKPLILLTNMMLFDKEKYLKIYRTQGLSEALTALHHDKERLEQLTFEGPLGYSRDLWDSLEVVRNFSVELWQLGLKEGKPSNLPETASIN